MTIPYVYVKDKDEFVITTINLDDVNYILKLLHNELDNRGFWGSVEESALETIEEIEKHIEKNTNKTLRTKDSL